MGRTTTDIGREAESRATRWLQARGVVPVATNVRLAGGEIDLVGRTEIGGEPLIVFVEVRSREDAGLGHPLETIDPRKQQRIVRAASAYLVREGLWERVAIRFDVVTVVRNPKGLPAHADLQEPDNWEFQWLPNAFEA